MMTEPVEGGASVHRKSVVIFSVLTGVVFFAAFAIAVAVMFRLTGYPWALLVEVPGWFDPVFFQYNLLMGVFGILIIPVITVLYVVRMKGEKRRRLKQDVPEQEWRDNVAYIDERLDDAFRLGNYMGSMLSLVLVVLFGVSILLLFKPMPWASGSDVIGSGVDFSRGANFMMLGPYMYQYVTGDEAWLARLMVSLSAFQFGFAGAYVYFIGHLVRSFFTLDLGPNIFVSSTIRMITGSVLALVLSFGLVDVSELTEKCTGPDCSLYSWVPLVGFFIGFFPSRGLMVLNNLASRLLQSAQPKYEGIPLGMISGMSYAHEVRLLREGYDNADNLAQACWLDLALHTGFRYTQLRAWSGQAWLHMHFGEEDYKTFHRATGIVGADDLQRYLDVVRKEGGEPGWSAMFDQSETKHIATKAVIVSELLGQWLERRVRKI